MEHLTLSERLAALRKKAGLSQAEVAAKLSLSRQAISKWESGKGLPSLITYSVLSTLYDVSIDLLLLGEEVLSADDLPKTQGKDFSEALREVRRHRKFSQESLAASLAVSRQSVSKWESGKAEPDADHLVALAKLLKVSLSQLLPSADSAETKVKKAPAPKPKPVKSEKTNTVEKLEKVEKPTTPSLVPKAPVIEAPKANPLVVNLPVAEEPKAPIAPKTVTPQAKPKTAKPAPEPLSRRQLLQERVRLAGQKERAAKAALGIKKKK